MRVTTKLAVPIVFLLSAGCSNAVDDGAEGVATVSDDNPFYTESTQPYQLPPFDRIDESHFQHLCYNPSDPTVRVVLSRSIHQHLNI